MVVVVTIESAKAKSPDGQQAIPQARCGRKHCLDRIRMEMQMEMEIGQAIIKIRCSRLLR